MEKGHRRGFTLVEVMIVMLLFSMLLLMIFPMRRMAVWVLDHARTQEQAEMLGDAAWRYAETRNLGGREPVWPRPCHGTGDGWKKGPV